MTKFGQIIDLLQHHNMWTDNHLWHRHNIHPDNELSNLVYSDPPSTIHHAGSNHLPLITFQSPPLHSTCKISSKSRQHHPTPTQHLISPRSSIITRRFHAPLSATPQTYKRLLPRHPTPPVSLYKPASPPLPSPQPPTPTSTSHLATPLPHPSRHLVPAGEVASKMDMDMDPDLMRHRHDIKTYTIDPPLTTAPSNNAPQQHHPRILISPHPQNSHLRPPHNRLTPPSTIQRDPTRPTSSQLTHHPPSHSSLDASHHISPYLFPPHLLLSSPSTAHPIITPRHRITQRLIPRWLGNLISWFHGISYYISTACM